MEGVRCVGVNLKRHRPFLKLGAGRAAPCAGWGGRQVCFRRDSPPQPQFLPPECPARAAVRGRGFPCSSSCTSHSVSGGSGGRLGKSSVPWQRLCRVPQTRVLTGVPRPLLPPAQLTPSGRRLPSTPPFLAASRVALGPDVSLASPPPRPRASGQELPPPAPVPRPPAAPNPAPRARRHE